MPNLPRILHRILREPIGHPVAAFTMLSGLALITSAGTTWQPAPAIDALPPHISVFIGALYLCGGAIALIGMQWRGTNVSRGWDTERLGWWLITAGLLFYSIIAAYIHPASIISWGSPAALAFGCGLKTVALLVRERQDRGHRDRIRKAGHA